LPPQILRTPEAYQDLLDIWTWVARETAPSVADAVLARIHGALEVLAFAPKIGRERHEFSGTPRSFVVRPMSSSMNRCGTTTAFSFGESSTARAICHA
jgi:plasmid stabilization system protein ParE